MAPTFPQIRDGALDRALADPSVARAYLAFAGAVDGVDGESAQLPVSVLVSMVTVTATHRTADENTAALVRGAALLVQHRDVTVGEAAALAGLPATVVSDAVETGRCRSSRLN